MNKIAHISVRDIHTIDCSAVPIRVKLGGGYNSAFLPIFRDFEILGVYSDFNYFPGFNDFFCDFEILEVYSGFNKTFGTRWSFLRQVGNSIAWDDRELFTLLGRTVTVQHTPDSVTSSVAVFRTNGYRSTHP